MNPRNQNRPSRAKSARIDPAATAPEGPDEPDEPDVAAPQEPAAAPQPGFPIVGIGASAGGLAAFEAFFAGMPAEADPEMAFVLVQHLAPDHKSILTELIRRYTRMQVFEVEDGMVVRPNCAYIIPPNRDMAFLNGSLQLLEPVSPRGQRLPIDFFFRSLAQDQHERAIGIVLSGTGCDGTQGVRAIKAEGGMVMAQNPASTEYDGMPRNAIATGLVDYELPPAEMAAQLIAYATHAFGPRAEGVRSLLPKTENAMKKVFILLRAQTGNDFSQYKPNTIHRRIERRMAMHKIDGLEAYVKFLQQTPAEVDALFRDLLIGVTGFFRDPEAFQALSEQIIAKIVKDKPADAVIRVWVPGCSTGEEAYSIAILLVEQLTALGQGRAVQIFATDIDSQAVATARIGLYPGGSVAEVSSQRLARFFIAEPGGAYRIQKSIRDLLIFSVQNVIKDPPFTRLDLISCRNLLIYFGGELQRSLIPLFHYALNPGGTLFLGTSESVGECSDLFDTVDRKAKIFLCRGEFHRTSLRHAFVPSLPAQAAAARAAAPAVAVKPRLRELTEQALLRRLELAGVLVNAQGDILYLHGRSGMYLEPAPGETGVPNILKMAREGLLRQLTMGLRKAVSSKDPVAYTGLRIRTNGHFTLVNLTIYPIEPTSARVAAGTLYLVVLEQAAAAAGGADVLPADAEPLVDSASRIQALTRELRAKEEYLHNANEELETSNEELKSSNEELQSVNEEMQSTNEELETSKEELQSVNEELATVNNELQTKVSDLSRANNDMSNLLSGTGIAILFVDCKQRILRYTPEANTLINLIPSDLGRPVGHLVSNLAGYDSMVEDIQAVLDTLIPREIEVRTRDGAWFIMRIIPYRTLENVIEGAVVSFVNVSEIRKIQEALLRANDLLRLAVVVRDAHDAITVQDLEGRITAWNPGAVRLYGWSEAEALAMNVRERIPPELRRDAMAKLHELSKAQVLESYRTRRLAKDGTSVAVSIISTALVNAAGEIYAIATTERSEGPGQ